MYAWILVISVFACTYHPVFHTSTETFGILLCELRESAGNGEQNILLSVDHANMFKFIAQICRLGEGSLAGLVNRINFYEYHSIE